jgi:hypothetical protein
MNLAFFVKTCTNIRSGHPFLKPTSIKSRGSEGVFKKCGKQEVYADPSLHISKGDFFKLAKPLDIDLNCEGENSPGPGGIKKKKPRIDEDEF